MAAAGKPSLESYVCLQGASQHLEGSQLPLKC